MRTTLSFGLAGMVAAAGFFSHAAILFGFPAGGLIAALLMGARTPGRGSGQRIAAMLIAMAGWGLTGLIVLFSLVSMQASIDPAWGAMAWGLGFGTGGAIAGGPLSRLWMPAGSDLAKVPWGGPIAGLAFAGSGAISGCLAFLGFANLGVHGLAVCVWLAYLLGGQICERGWNASLHWSRQEREVPGTTGYRIEPPARPVLASADRRARKAATWAVAACCVLVLVLVKTRWPIPWLDLILLTVWQVPLMMLGLREVTSQAVCLLLVLGAPALVWGIAALRSSRQGPAALTGRSRRHAMLGVVVGAAFTVLAILLLLPPASGRFTFLYGKLLVASARSASEWDRGNRIYQGNILMGRAALRSGDLATARSYLLAAGRSPGSPQLETFGPDMALAREMLAAGQNQPVLEFLELCHRFWKADEGRLERWKRDIREGRVPAFESGR